MPRRLAPSEAAALCEQLVERRGREPELFGPATRNCAAASPENNFRRYNREFLKVGPTMPELASSFNTSTQTVRAYRQRVARICLKVELLLSNPTELPGMHELEFFALRARSPDEASKLALVVGKLASNDNIAQCHDLTQLPFAQTAAWPTAAWPLRVLAQRCVRRGSEEPRYEYLAEWLDTETVHYPANQSPLGWLVQRKGGWSTRASTRVDISNRDMTECIALYVHGQLSGSEALPSGLRSTAAQQKYIAENRACVREDATLRHEHERVLRIFDMFECVLRFTALAGTSKPCAAVRCAEMVAPMNVGTPRALDLSRDDVNRAWAISRQIANSDQALFRRFEQHARKKRAVTAKNSVALFRAFARYVAGDIGAALNHGGCRHKKLSRVDELNLLKSVQENPQFTMEQLKNDTGLEKGPKGAYLARSERLKPGVVTDACVNRALKRMGVSFKKLTPVYGQRREQGYKTKITKWINDHLLAVQSRNRLSHESNRHSLIFVDEFSVYLNISREHGHGLRGRDAVVYKRREPIVPLRAIVAIRWPSETRTRASNADLERAPVAFECGLLQLFSPIPASVAGAEDYDPEIHDETPFYEADAVGRFEVFRLREDVRAQSRATLQLPQNAGMDQIVARFRDNQQTPTARKKAVLNNLSLNASKYAEETTARRVGFILRHGYGDAQWFLRDRRSGVKTENFIDFIEKIDAMDGVTKTSRNIVVMDNASIHLPKRQDATSLAARLQAKGYENTRVVFLPPYCPELNPVEKTIGFLKGELRRKAVAFGSLVQREAGNLGLSDRIKRVKEELRRAMQQVTRQKLLNWYFYSGYFHSERAFREAAAALGVPETECRKFQCTESRSLGSEYNSYVTGLAKRELREAAGVYPLHATARQRPDGAREVVYSQRPHGREEAAYGVMEKTDVYKEYVKTPALQRKALLDARKRFSITTDLTPFPVFWEAMRSEHTW